MGKPADERATQDIAPATRRAVLRRDRHRCQAPGCRHATFVDLHHVQSRADGGGHDASNLVTLCGAHHRALHEGALIITGSVGSGLEFWHADGPAYGSPATAPRGLQLERALRALRGLGFGEKEARRTLEQTLRELEPAAELESVLRRSLELLTQRALRRSA